MNALLLAANETTAARRWFLASIGLTILCCLLPGCSTGTSTTTKSGHRQSPGPAIERLSLLCTPVAFTGGPQGGINGIAAKLFAAAEGDKKTRAIPAGQVEFFMFDGMLRGFPAGGQGGRHMWAFEAAELKPMKISTAIGTAYQFALCWGEDTPRAATISIIARYRLEDGPEVFSAPCYVTLGQ